MYNDYVALSLSLCVLQCIFFVFPRAGKWRRGNVLNNWHLTVSQSVSQSASQAVSQSVSQSGYSTPLSPSLQLEKKLRCLKLSPLKLYSCLPPFLFHSSSLFYPPSLPSSSFPSLLASFPPLILPSMYTSHCNTILHAVISKNLKICTWI